MRFGLLLPHFNFRMEPSELIALARDAERLGFGSLWVRDHVYISPEHREHGGISESGFVTESLLTLAYIAGATSDVLLGTAVLTAHRHPVKTAQLLATLDHLSGGRVVCGIGGGSDEKELVAVGEDFSTRLERTRDTVELARALWQGGPYDALSEELQELIHGCGININPAPRQLPFWYGGITDNSIDRAVAFADGWLPSRLPFDRLESKVKRCHERLEAAGRNRDEFSIAAIPQISIADSREEARSRVSEAGVVAEAMRQRAIHAGRTDLTLDDLRGQMIWGTAEDICEDVDRYRTMGVPHVVFDSRHDFAGIRETMMHLGERVIPEFR